METRIIIEQFEIKSRIFLPALPVIRVLTNIPVNRCIRLNLFQNLFHF